MTKSRDTADSINRIDSSAADATAITIDANENVGIGTTSPSALLGVNGRLTLGDQASSGTAGAGSMIVGASALYIQASENQNSSTKAPIVFSNIGGSSESMRILSGGGITFNGDTAAANALDDYENGTWTPVVAQGWTSVTFPNSYQNGNYVKVGNLVTAWFYLQFSGTNASQHVRISGLPFNSPNEPAGAFRGGAVTYFNIPVNSTGMILAYVAHNSNYIEFYSGDDAPTSTNSNANASSNFLIGSVTYRAS